MHDVILVCGGREYGMDPREEEQLRTVLDTTFAGRMTPTAILQGGARGADWLAGQWARRNAIPLITHYADWDTYGKAAGSIRNGEMLEWWKPVLVIAFPGGAGTHNMIEKARAAGVSTVEVPCLKTKRR